ncbi:MAG: hypothetical protein GYA24_03265 [Candidatus Lokiarchaeota archaeon]|nr:hypothetical protein [Candidatus Lokiarchaeota archaeon]
MVTTRFDFLDDIDEFTERIYPFHRCEICWGDSAPLRQTCHGQGATFVCERCIPACNNHSDHVVKIASRLVEYFRSRGVDCYGPDAKLDSWKEPIVVVFEGTRAEILEAFQILRDATPGDLPDGCEEPCESLDDDELPNWMK